MSAGAYAKRGEVWLVDLGYAAKARPCLVFSIAAEDTDRALTTVVPHTTSVERALKSCSTSVSCKKAHSTRKTSSPFPTPNSSENSAA